MVCADRGIALIEDCAQAAGARRNGRRAGAFGDAAAFSFYPTKNLGALGDGGAVATSSDEIAERVRRLRQYGWGRKYEVTLEGGRNSRLDELQAAILRARLPRLDEANAARRSIVRRYAEALAARTPGASSRATPRITSHTWPCSWPTSRCALLPRSIAPRSRPRRTTRFPTTARLRGAPTMPTLASRSPSTRASTC